MTKKNCPRFDTYKYVRYVSYFKSPFQDGLDCIYNQLLIGKSCPLDLKITHDETDKTFCLLSNTLQDIKEAESILRQEIETYENHD